jgi:uracil-DNA glycosylase
MQQKLDISEIKQKMFEKLEPSGWGRIFKPFIFSGDFDNIILQLAKLSSDGKRFTPVLKDVFRAFEECPYDKLKVIMVGQDPYPGFGQADGIAFSCSKTNELQPSLKFMLNEVVRTVYSGHPESTDVDLKRWSNQGVLMLNTALTTTINKIGQHYTIWQPFMAYLFDHLTWNTIGLVYIYMGKEAKSWEDAVNDNNYKIFTMHPASGVYQQTQSWDCKDMFNLTNDFLIKNNNTKIIW